ncbi:MAG: GatB/YqeY domain-containing protein, partial [Thaumarchaeota archaeon]|nr:GatB/YqeY domain-containing protein [Nitrososphaerota archaeon]
ILREYVANPGISADEAVAKSGVSSISDSELEKIVDEVIAQNQDVIRNKGASGAERMLMGKVMQKVRGKADGKVVSETLSKHLSEFEKGKS